MKRVKLIATACFTAMLAVLTLNAAAQDFNTNERTFLTFSNAVELPGVTLQPGTYVFRLADSQSNRHIVQVLSQDEKQIHATILAVPAERLEVSGENVVTFRESAEGATPAVQYWYYPGDRIGHEFVYPKDQAMRIAARTGQNVLSTEGDITSSEARVSSTNPQGETTEWNREGSATRQGAATAEASGVQGTSGISQTPQTQTAEGTHSAHQQPAQTAQREQQTAQSAQQTAPVAQTQPESNESVNPRSETPDPAEPETAPAEPAAQSATGTAGTSAQGSGQAGMTRENQAVGTSGQAQDRPAQSAEGRAQELPRTASPLPLSGLIGLLSLGGALVARRVRK